jgi:pimeloyl-ACP methyl ester carboxylesterase
MSIWSDFLGAEVRQVDVDGVSTRVLTAGSGDRVIVLLHGRGGHLESWRANVAALAEQHRVVAFDMLGHGLTGRHGDDYGVNELAGHALATLDALSIGSATLVGQSIGGWVAALIALRRPGIVRSLVLIEPAGFQSESERKADPQFAAVHERGGRAFEEPTADAVRDRLLGLVADPSVIDEELVEVRRILYQPAEARAVHRAVRAADNRAVLMTPSALEQLQTPALLIHGEEAHTPIEVVESAAQAARARLVTVPGTAQWPQLERPDVVNALIIEWEAAR